MWDQTRPYATYKTFVGDEDKSTFMLTLRDEITSDEWDGILNENELESLYELPHDAQSPAHITIERNGEEYTCVRADLISPALKPLTSQIEHAKESDMFYLMCRDINTGWCYPIAFTLQNDFFLGMKGDLDDCREPVDSMDRRGYMLSDLLPENKASILTGTVYRDNRFGSFRLA